MNSEEKLTMSLGEAMFSQRAIRRFKPDLIPDEALQVALEAATKAPNGSNLQPWRFLVDTGQPTSSRNSPSSTTRPGGPSVGTRASFRRTSLRARAPSNPLERLGRRDWRRSCYRAGMRYFPRRRFHGDRSYPQRRTYCSRQGGRGLVGCLRPFTRM